MTYSQGGRRGARLPRPAWRMVRTHFMRALHRRGELPTNPSSRAHELPVVSIKMALIGHFVVLYFGLVTVCTATPISARAFDGAHQAAASPGGLPWPALAAVLAPWVAVAAVVGNLGFSARETHRWYTRTFPNYPRNRSALLPGLL
eukprot:1185614-Prorocentrum_minimum.AAC.1